MICIKVNIKGNEGFNKGFNKGFILIEVVISCFLIGIITSVYIASAYKYSKNFRCEVKSTRESFYVNEAFIIIQQKIDDSEQVKIKDNRIGLKTTMGVWNYIRKDRDSDIIISYNGVYSPYTNNILKNVKNFNIEDRQGVIYICIQMHSGKLYERCVNLQWKRKIEDL